jgi:hypothetical protein
MAKLLRSNGAPLGAQITLFPGNRLQFKVSGLGPNRKHLVLRSTDSVLSVVPLRVDDRRAEQVLRLEVQDHSIVSRRVVHLDAYVTDAQGRLQHKDSNTARLTVELEPRLKLPEADTEAGILARMLIVENAAPSHPKFVSLDESLESMQWMVHVLRNRLKLGPQHFSARGASTLTTLIKAQRQVEGFEQFPQLAPAQNVTLNAILNLAHDGADNRYRSHQIFVEHAIAVSKGTKAGADPCPKKLYAWKTEGSDSPGHNFVKFRAKGGQDFYTLTDAFLAQLTPNTSGALEARR